MIYCPKCSHAQERPVLLGDTQYTQGSGAIPLGHAVYDAGKVIHVSGSCPVCGAVIHVEQTAKLNEDGSYTILSVSQ